MKKAILLLMLIVGISAGSIHAMQEPSMLDKLQQLKNSPNFYYKQYYIERELKAGKQPHTPCLFIIDPENADKDLLTLKAVLRAALKSDFFPIIVSYDVFVNYFDPNFEKMLYQREYIRSANMLMENKYLPEFHTSWPKFCANWNTYDVPNSQFLLLMPRHTPILGFKTDSLPPIITEKLLFISFDSFKEKMARWHKKEPGKSKNFSVDDLKKIFIPKTATQTTQPIFDFYIDGHGYIKTYIGGLSPQELNALLRFFDQHLTTGFVAISSCYAGGFNKTLLLKNAENIQLSHPYPIVVISASNEPTAARPDAIYAMSSYFNNAANLTDKGETLITLLKALAPFLADYKSPQGGLLFPQIWLPGGVDFNAINFSTDVFNVTNVLATTYAQEKKDIIIKNKRLALIYPQTIEGTLEIYPREYSTEELKLKYFENPALNYYDIRGISWETMPEIVKLLRFEKDEPFYAVVERTHKNMESMPAVYKALSQGWISPANFRGINYLYPHVLIMNANGVHRINHVVVKNENAPMLGIMRFIRDGFFGTANEIGTGILIDKLTGPNDISALLEASYAYADDKQYDEMKKLHDQLKETYFKPITLTNVIIRAIETKNPRTYVFSIRFEYENKAWVFLQKNEKEAKELKSFIWQTITEYPLAEHRKRFEELATKSNLQYPTIEQKSLAEVLKQKLEKIRSSPPS